MGCSAIAKGCYRSRHTCDRGADRVRRVIAGQAATTQSTSSCQAPKLRPVWSWHDIDNCAGAVIAEADLLPPERY